MAACEQYFCARRRTSFHTRLTLLGPSAVPNAMQNTHLGLKLTPGTFPHPAAAW